MTELQKLALDAIDINGSLTLLELECACLIGRRQRGGFRRALVPLFEQRLLLVAADAVHITKQGVHAIEAENRRSEQ